MIERVVENWLTRTSEISLQVPFCQLLAGEGYQVVHLARHGPAEEGKDVIAIAPNGTACAFQLKNAQSGKITQKAWETFVPQVTRLVEIPIKHPSVDRDLPTQPYFVTNGELDEEVRTEIDHRNDYWERRGYPRLQTVVKGQLLARFKKMQMNFWPTGLRFEKTLLELFLADGSGCLDKPKLAEFLLSLLPLYRDRLNTAQCSRSLSSAAIFTAYALSPYAEKQNHVALIEGWTVYLAALAALAEKYRLKESDWKEALAVTQFAIEQAFESLCHELEGRNHLIEGDPLTEAPFYRGRVTWLVGLVAAFALWKRLRDPKSQIGDFPKAFVNSHRKDLLLWGEAAIPQWLAIIWFLPEVMATSEPDILLHDMISSICALNEGETSTGLADPYHGLGDVVLEQHGIIDDPQREHYKGRSYALESLVHLFARRGWRQHLRFLWPDITQIDLAEFRPAASWQFCLWACEDGQVCITRPKRPQSWAELRDQAAQVDLSTIPDVFRRHPELLLVFVLTYPHRLTKDVAKFLDDRIHAARLGTR